MDTTKEYDPIYKQVKFKNKAEFNHWLNKTTKYKLEFEDH